MCKGLWDRAYGLSSLSEKTRKSNRLQMLLQRQHFLLSYLKTLSVGPAGVWTYGLPLSRLVLDPLRLPGGGYEMCRDGMNLFQNESHSGILCIAPYCCVVALMMQHVDARYSCKRSERWLWHFRPLRHGWEKCTCLDYYLSHVSISCQQALRVLHLVNGSIILIYWFFTSFYRARQMSDFWAPSRVSWRSRPLLYWR